MALDAISLPFSEMEQILPEPNGFRYFHLKNEKDINSLLNRLFLKILAKASFCRSQ